MKRNQPLKRKTPLRGNPSKNREWQQRSRRALPTQSDKRARETREYGGDRPAFLAAHPICPVTGERTTQVHHSAKREKQWLNLQRYWIAVSAGGHQLIEDNKTWAEGVGLMVRIREPYAAHCQVLRDEGISLDEPLFYQHWNGEQLCPPH